MKRTEMTRTSMKRSRTSNGAFDADTRALAVLRAGGMCEVCGVAPIEQHHHRRARGSGGSRSASTSSVSNDLAVCAADHQRIESNRGWALMCGYLVRQGWEPADVAVNIRGRHVFLTTNGTYLDVPEEA